LWFGNNTVIIIIGILAAIAIPTFLAQRERAWEAAAQSDLRNAAAAATSCSAANDGAYTNCAVANLGQFGFNPTQNVNLAAIAAPTANRWAYTSTNALDAANPTTYTFDTTPPAGAAYGAGRVECTAGC
jgi:type IV pilus assembly protein PilA